MPVSLQPQHLNTAVLWSTYDLMVARPCCIVSTVKGTAQYVSTQLFMYCTKQLHVSITEHCHHQAVHKDEMEIFRAACFETP
jgi:hypothetical protein